MTSHNFKVGQKVRVPHGVGHIVGFEKLEPWAAFSELPEEPDSRIVVELRKGHEWFWDCLYYVNPKDILEVL